MMTKKEFCELLEQKRAYFDARAIALEGALRKLPDCVFANGYTLEMARLDKAMDRANAKVADAVMRANYTALTIVPSNFAWLVGRRWMRQPMRHSRTKGDYLHVDRTTDPSTVWAQWKSFPKPVFRQIESLESIRLGRCAVA